MISAEGAPVGHVHAPAAGPRPRALTRGLGRGRDAAAAASSSSSSFSPPLSARCTSRLACTSCSRPAMASLSSSLSAGEVAWTVPAESPEAGEPAAGRACIFAATALAWVFALRFLPATGDAGVVSRRK